MKTTTKTILLLVCTFNITMLCAQVRIGQDARPTQGATLDLNSTNSTGYHGGLLLPNINILHVHYIPKEFTERKELYGQTGQGVDLTGLIVYNTNEKLLDENDKLLGCGIFVWDGYKWHAVGLTQVSENGGGDNNELPSGPDIKDEYDEDVEGNIFIKGTNCLSVQNGYDPASGSAPSIYDKEDNLFLEGTNSNKGYNNLVQSYTVVGEIDNLSKIFWEILDKSYGGRSVAEHIESIVFSDPLDGSGKTSTEDDGTFLTCTITYKPNGGKTLESAINELCPNENGRCFVRLEISVYYTYVDNGSESQLISSRTCYFQNYTCCEGYICENCAYDYVNGTPGNWAEVGIGETGNYSHPNIALHISGNFNSTSWDESYIPTLEAGFNKESAGDLCVYKTYSASQPSTWIEAITACQEGEITDGKEDFGWYLPNLMELYQIYIAFGGDGYGHDYGDTTGLGTEEDFDGGEGMYAGMHWTSTELKPASGNTISSSLTFNFYDGSIGNFSKSAKPSGYKVRCVRRM